MNRAFRLGTVAVALALPLPALAQDPPGRSPANPQALWSFSRCLAERAPEDLARLLGSAEWGGRQRRAIKKLSEANVGCGSMKIVEDGLDNTTLRGAMAGSIMVQRYAGRSLPDYSGTPDVFGVADMLKFNGAAFSSVQQAKAALYRQVYLGFGECVFRRMPQSVLGLLQSEISSAAENTRIAQLNPVLSDCVPAEGGEQIRFTRIGLRAIVGEGAFAVDQAFAVARRETVH